MNVVDYEFTGTETGWIAIEEYINDSLGAVTGIFEFTFTTYTDYYWYSPDGYHEMELPCLALDELEITGVRYEDEMGNVINTSFSRMAVEGDITKLIIDNLGTIEEMIKEDY